MLGMMLAGLGGVLLVIGTFVLAPRLALWWPLRGVPAGSPDPVAVVLGCRVPANGRASLRMRRRVELAARLYRRGKVRHLILTGAAVYTAHGEAETMAAIARQMGVPDAAIIIEDRARSTIGNAIQTRDLLMVRGWRSCHLVTDGSHVFRASLIFSRCGIPHRAWSTGIVGAMNVKSAVLLPLWESWLLWRIWLGLDRRLQDPEGWLRSRGELPGQ